MIADAAANLLAGAGGPSAPRQQTSNSTRLDGTSDWKLSRKELSEDALRNGRDGAHAALVRDVAQHGQGGCDLQYEVAGGGEDCEFGAGEDERLSRSQQAAVEGTAGEAIPAFHLGGGRLYRGGAGGSVQKRARTQRRPPCYRPLLGRVGDARAAGLASQGEAAPCGLALLPRSSHVQQGGEYARDGPFAIDHSFGGDVLASDGARHDDALQWHGVPRTCTQDRSPEAPRTHSQAASSSAQRLIEPDVVTEPGSVTKSSVTTQDAVATIASNPFAKDDFTNLVNATCRSRSVGALPLVASAATLERSGSYSIKPKRERSVVQRRVSSQHCDGMTNVVNDIGYAFAGKVVPLPTFPNEEVCKYKNYNAPRLLTPRTRYNHSRVPRLRLPTPSPSVSVGATASHYGLGYSSELPPRPPSAPVVFVKSSDQTGD